MGNRDETQLNRLVKHNVVGLVSLCLVMKSGKNVGADHAKPAPV